MKNSYSEDHIRDPLTESVNAAKKHAKQGRQHHSEEQMDGHIIGTLKEVFLHGSYQVLAFVFNAIIYMLAHAICLPLHHSHGSRFVSLPLAILTYYLISIYGFFVGITKSLFGGGNEFYLYHFFSQLMILCAVIHFVRIQLQRQFGWWNSKPHTYSFSVGISFFQKTWERIVANTKIPSLSPDAFIKWVEAPMIVLVSLLGYYILDIAFFKFTAACGVSLFILMNKRDSAMYNTLLDLRDSELINSVVSEAMQENHQESSYRSRQGFSISKAMVSDLRETYKPAEDQYSEEINQLKKEQNLGGEDEPKSS